MTPDHLTELLNSVRNGTIAVDDALEHLRHFPFQDLGCAQVDHHRELRQGMPEVIFGEGKTVEQTERVMSAMAAKGSNILATRLTGEKASRLQEAFPLAVFHADARCLTLEQHPIQRNGRGTVMVVSAGTSDIPVAAEALVTAAFLGNETTHVYDVGVAGIHRLLARRELLCSAAVIIVVAGMEGALPSVVGGLVNRPVIAVPTSIGYGAAFGGIAALLGMLNSCAAGVTVVNIDNGFGAACAANLINRG
ncbi:nickel pincer cofactor biosynthesis protein LarB [Geobacter sp. SVR]|uniref:nickel pincer cofactor biosynthesis protein LarB n=1 Tax=Geobacter sp. SVR TaxID=2495594 RepID=UPI00143F03BB|nr:nickel pincer cofactor biosynthesis protein LarB [Geobacter sp. SVR]BCS55552.1 1-(5-phosphoribosyl)-5-amino-4-imidazole-carboxyl ate carboxylase [Geobacter sp. SVR]GCF83555.1 1-(5-phosphoribosyl)-5-amino-4-imidazole-carboxylate carboxylase [Geobacter sp. SVR]